MPPDRPDGGGRHAVPPTGQSIVQPTDKPSAQTTGQTPPPSGCERLTAPGPAAIAALRLTGAPVAAFLERHLRPRAPQRTSPEVWSAGAIRRAALLDPDGMEVDDLLVAVTAGPPDWDVRLCLHGSPYLVQACEQWAAAAGLPLRSPAAPWRGDSVIAAEALGLLPRMLTEAGCTWLLRSAQALLDFAARCRAAADAAPALSAAPDSNLNAEARRILQQPVRAEWFLRPLRIGLVGPPNAGKSTLMNALTDQPVSLTSPQPGTTRDWVEAPGEVAGYPVVWVDTAGLRRATDPIEAEGVARTEGLLSGLDLFVIVLDGTASAYQPVVRELAAAHSGRCLVALNKQDLPGWSAGELADAAALRQVALSAERRTGLDDLVFALLSLSGRSKPQPLTPAAFTDRQREFLERISEARTLDVLSACAADLCGSCADALSGYWTKSVYVGKP